MTPLLRARARLRRARHWIDARLGGAFFRPVLTLVSGVVTAQALAFAARPLLTRLYTPDEFGVLTLFVTVVSLLGLFATGRYDDAQMLPAARRDAAGLLLLALAAAAVTALAAALLTPWRDGWAALLNSPAFAPALLLVPLGVLALAWGQALEAWHTRFDRFRIVSAARVVQSLAVVGFQVGAGLLGAGALGLVEGAAVGFGAFFLLVAVPLVMWDGAVVRAGARRGAMRRLARRYRQFPLFSAPAVFFNMLSARAPVFLLAGFFGDTTVGLFGLAFGTLATPVGVVTGAVGKVYMVRAAEARRQGALGPLTRQVHRRLVAVSLFPMAAAALAGPDLFAFVFGEAWEEAGVYARLLAPWLFASAVASPLTRVFDVTERLRASFGFSVAQLVVLTAALTAAATAGDAPLAVGVAGAAGTLTRLAQVGWMLHLAGTSVRAAAADLGRHLLYAVPALLPALGVLAAAGGPLLLLVALALGALGFLAVTARADRRAGPS